MAQCELFCGRGLQLQIPSPGFIGLGNDADNLQVRHCQQRPQTRTGQFGCAHKDDSQSGHSCWFSNLSRISDADASKKQRQVTPVSERLTAAVDAGSFAEGAVLASLPER